MPKRDSNWVLASSPSPHVLPSCSARLPLSVSCLCAWCSKYLQPGSKFSAHKPQRDLGLACRPGPNHSLEKHLADPQLPSRDRHRRPSPTTTIPALRCRAIQDSHMRASLEVFIQSGQLGKRKEKGTERKRESESESESKSEHTSLSLSSKPPFLKHSEPPDPQKSAECLIRPC